MYHVLNTNESIVLEVSTIALFLSILKYVVPLT